MDPIYIQSGHPTILLISVKDLQGSLEMACHRERNHLFLFRSIKRALQCDRLIHFCVYDPTSLSNDGQKLHYDVRNENKNGNGLLEMITLSL